MARPLAWGDTTLDILLVDGTNFTALNLLLNVTASDTISTMRIVGKLQVVPSSLSTAVDNISVVDLGIGVTSQEAFAAQVLPDPHANEQPPRGWLWKDRSAAVYGNNSGTIESWNYPVMRFDIRSSRKVDRGILFLNGRSAFTVGVAFSWRLVGHIRVLCAT